MTLHIIHISALVSLIPSILASFRRIPQRDVTFWSSLIIAIFGVAVVIFIDHAAGWNKSISSALWLTTFICLVLHVLLSSNFEDGWRLTPLLIPYLFILGVLATAGAYSSTSSLLYDASTAWMGVHIFVSVITYGLINLAAVAALAATVQTRALKRKQMTNLSMILPSVRVSERLCVRLLTFGELFLALGLITGMASLYAGTGELLVFDHKTSFTLLVFFIIGILLLTNYRSGTRGKAATRLVLLAYLLLTLGYPGVKVVTDIIL